MALMHISLNKPLLLKITFPYLWFVTFVAFSGAVLNTIGKFGVMSFSPVLLNIAMIATALFLAPQMDNPDLALAIGIFLAAYYSSYSKFHL